jgi:predicted nucleic acid-binding protein
MRVLVDTNVLIDFIAQRFPFCTSAEQIVYACGNGKIEGYIAAHSISNLFYILRKQYTVEERRQVLKDMCTLFTVVEIDSKKIVEALGDNGFDDLEDCLQEKCAVAVEADYIITRNIKDFMNAQVKSLDSETFVNTVLNKRQEQ